MDRMSIAMTVDNADENDDDVADVHDEDADNNLGDDEGDENEDDDEAASHEAPNVAPTRRICTTNQTRSPSQTEGRTHPTRSPDHTKVGVVAKVLIAPCTITVGSRGVDAAATRRERSRLNTAGGPGSFDVQRSADQNAADRSRFNDRRGVRDQRRRRRDVNPP